MFAGSVLRRAVAWAMLALYGLVTSGLPLPVLSPPEGTVAAKVAGKDRSRPFPCMDKACGCDSAERCFTSCCCHTPAETLAWAKARGLEPAVITALQRRVAVAAPAPAAGGCCAVKQQAKPSCCAASDDGEAAEDSVCGDSTSLAGEPVSPPSSDEPAPTDEPTPNDEPGCKVVILRAMLACGGIVAQWAAAGVSLPPPGTVTCEFPSPSIGTVVIRDEQASDRGGPPDLPPPRSC